MSQDLRNKLFTEAANKAVKSAVEQLNPAIEKSTSPPASGTETNVKKFTDEAKTTTSRAISDSPKDSKVLREIKGIVYLTDVDEAKVGDICSVMRHGKEIAVVEITEVKENTAKATIIDGAGIKPNDKVKVIQ